MVISMVRRIILEMVLLNYKIKILDFIKKYWLEILSLLIMSLLVLINLNVRYFAADEGYNVTMGQYILRNNWIPKVWDGRNIITTINGNDFNNNFILTNLNWGAYYLSALAQLLFGHSEYFIRLPFALFGIFSSLIWYKYFIYKTNDKNISKIFLVIYCLSISIIIYSRNANYFSPSLFFMGLMYLYNYKSIHQKKRIHTALYIIFCFIQFHVNYMLFLFTFIPLLFEILIEKKVTKIFLFKNILVTLITLPFFIWMRYNFDIYNSNYRNITLIPFKTGYIRFLEQFWHLNYFIAPIFILLFIKISIDFLYKKKKKIPIDDGILSNFKNLKIIIHWHWLFSIFFNLIFLTFFTLEYETRYYLAIFPFLFISVAYIINNIYKKDKIISFIILGLILFSNIINMIPFQIAHIINKDEKNSFIKYIIQEPVPSAYKEDYNLNSYFLRYVSHYTKNYVDEVHALVSYLNENAKNDDVINVGVIDPWVNSIQYYSDLRLVNNLRLNFGSWANDKDYYNAERYYNLVSYPDEKVDWVIYTDNPEVVNIMNLYMNNDEYEKIYIDKTLSGMQNDIWLYSFESLKSPKKIMIFKKK